MKKWLLSEKAGMVGLLAIVLAGHVVWFHSYGRLELGGDQAAYREAGRALLKAAVEGPAGSPAALEEARRWLDFAGVGLFYGIVDALWPDDLQALWWSLVALQLLSTLGVYCLARTVHGRTAAGIAGLFCALSPAFPAHAARLYPDPLTAALLTWGLVLYCRASGWVGFVSAGIVFGTGLFVRVQLLPWALAMALAGFVLSAPRWLRSATPRRRALGTAAGLGLVAGASWMLTACSLPVQDSRAPKHNLPRYQYYAYGVWQYAESDGWEGPYRLKSEPFYRALVAAATRDPALLESRPRQYAFALEYMWTRRGEFGPLILDNAYRMWDRPVNPEHRPFPLPLAAQRLVHRIAVLAALLGAGLVVGRAAWLLPVALVPLSVAALHALAYPWLRYTTPVLPIVLALAGIALAELWSRRGELAGPWTLGLVSTVAGLAASAWLGRDAQPEASRWLAALAAAIVVAVPFLWTRAWQVRSVPKWTTTLLGLVAMACVLSHAVRSRTWHDRAIWLEPGEAIRQTILIQPAGIARLEAAPESYLTLDLELREGDMSGLRVRLNGRDLSKRLQATMPPLREAIPDATEALYYPQWWALTLIEEDLADIRRRGQAEVELERVSGTPVCVKADRFTGQDTTYEGPSWGEWPNAVGLKPEYDREYRLYVQRPLASVSTRSEMRRRGTWHRMAAAPRIRLVALADRVGTVSWSMGKPSSRGTPLVAVFAARSGVRRRGLAELRVADRLVAEFPIGVYGDYAVSGPSGRLCYVNGTRLAQNPWDAGGIYAVTTIAPLDLEVVFRPGMTDRPMMFGLEGHQPSPETAAAVAARCEMAGPVEVGIRSLQARGNNYPEDLGRWSVEALY